MARAKKENAPFALSILPIQIRRGRFERHGHAANVSCTTAIGFRIASVEIERLRAMPSGPMYAEMCVEQASRRGLPH